VRRQGVSDQASVTCRTSLIPTRRSYNRVFSSLMSLHNLALASTHAILFFFHQQKLQIPRDLKSSVPDLQDRLRIIQNQYPQGTWNHKPSLAEIDGLIHNVINKSPSPALQTIALENAHSARASPPPFVCSNHRVIADFSGLPGAKTTFKQGDVVVVRSKDPNGMLRSFDFMCATDCCRVGWCEAYKTNPKNASLIPASYLDL
jgi:hypothetical protein